MTLQDFNLLNQSGNDWVSKDRFWFESNKVSFWYRLYINVFEFQPGWNADVYNTRYTISLVVDTESIHPNHLEEHEVNKGELLSGFDLLSFGYALKQVERKGKRDLLYIDKLIASALKLKIENKIKVDNYQKILGITNGETFYV